MTSTANPSPEFWTARRVLVTGHTGFVGTWLSTWLMELGAELHGISRGHEPDAGLFRRTGLGAALPSVSADVGDRSSVGEAVRTIAPEVVLHLAGQPLEPAALRDPLGTYRTNVMGTVNLLDAVRQVDTVRVLIVVTTDRCYEPRDEDWPYREVEPLGGRTPYASSKACMELVTRAFGRSFFDPGGPMVATARTSNLVGGGDWTEGRLVPDLLRGAQDGNVVRLLHPGSRRAWQHVLDPVRGYLLLAERLWEDRTLPDCWNFGPDEYDVRSAGWVADRLAAHWGDGLRWEAEANPPPDTSGLLRLDSARAKRRLGWGVRWHVDRALKAVVDFQRRAADARGDLGRTLRSQIADHQASGR